MSICLHSERHTPSKWTHCIWIQRLKKESVQHWCLPRLYRRNSRTLYVSHVCVCLLLSRIVFDICSRQICLGLVVFRDEKSTEARCEAKMWEGSWWGSLWLIFPLATWQGEDVALIMNCDTLMSLSCTDNTWSALVPLNPWYQRGKIVGIYRLVLCHFQRQNQSINHSLPW